MVPLVEHAKEALGPLGIVGHPFNHLLRTALDQQYPLL